MTSNAIITNIDPFGSATGTNENKSVVQETSATSGTGETEQAGTTKFTEDSNVVAMDVSKMAHIDNTILNLSDTNMDEQSIKSFLSKPIVLASGSFSVADTYSFLNSYSLPYTALTAGPGAIWREKLRGVFGIRMDMKVRIVVNANRFQQGRYCLGWVPLAAPLLSTSSLKEIAFNNSHMATLVQRTTVPHVEIDLSTDTVAELYIPYVSSRSFYGLTSVLSSTNNFPLGYLNLYPYSPLVSPAGSTVAGYTIYITFENVRLFGAASPQSGFHTNVQKREVSNKNNGPISSVSSALSKGFREFAQVPLLSTYANSIAWVADRVTGVASVFGWSKPIAGDSLLKVAIYQGATHSTVDGDSDAKAMSYMSKPGVTSLDGVSGTQYDEMDFSYIARKPAWFRTFTWNTTQGVGLNLTNIDVQPYAQIATGGATHFPPVSFVASFFRMWRGSIRYRFKVVKTEFHSGRLEFCFFPEAWYQAYTGDATYVQRNIVDIREHSEFDFVIPYICDMNYTSVRTGSFRVNVVDPLVAPATVSSTVTILCEICGGEDLEFAIPATFNATPTMFVPQSGLGGEVNKLLEVNIGNSNVVANPHVSSSISVGDKVSSFRSYLKRFHVVRGIDATTSSVTMWNGTNFSMIPDVLFGTTTVPGNTYIRSDIYSTVASCYAITRGGIRIRNVINKGLLTGTRFNGPSMVKTVCEATNSAGFNLNPVISGTGGVEEPPNAHISFQDVRNNGIITHEIPQYTHTYARSVCDQTFYQGTGAYGVASSFDASLSGVQLSFYIPLTNAASVPVSTGQQLHNIYRSAADDADFGCFISVPAMRVGVASDGAVPYFY
jgi:hypothetical protein